MKPRTDEVRWLLFDDDELAELQDVLERVKASNEGWVETTDCEPCPDCQPQSGTDTASTPNAPSVSDQFPPQNKEEADWPGVTLYRPRLRPGPNYALHTVSSHAGLNPETRRYIPAPEGSER